MEVGGRRGIKIPPIFAYANAAPAASADDETLVFVINLIAVN